MPYIPSSFRMDLDVHIKALEIMIDKRIPVDRVKALTYAVYALMKYYYGYGDFTNRTVPYVILNSVMREIERTSIDPYEEMRREENGDVIP